MSLDGQILTLMFNRMRAKLSKWIHVYVWMKKGHLIYNVPQNSKYWEQTMQNISLTKIWIHAKYIENNVRHFYSPLGKNTQSFIDKNYNVSLGWNL